MHFTMEFPLFIWFVGAGLLLMGFYAFAIERFRLEVRRVDIPLSKLPRSCSGLRIALFSDVHLSIFYSPKRLSGVVELINREHPDIVCFTGDFLDAHAGTGVLREAAPILGRLKASLGKFAVLGNHDCWAGVNRVGRTLELGGFRVLSNDHAVLQKNRDRLYMIGLADVSKGRPDLTKAMLEIPEEACSILLVHEPDFADTVARRPVSLQLSGHSHGGQVRLPYIGPLITTRLGRKYHSGLYKIDNLLLYTTWGVGTTLLPVRFFCRPEITIITLNPIN
ncbi:MAG: putative metallophosphoesterase [Pelotomaculum sp. PtaB.Bin104]|nr:MAG: putative metallophosphoesterase [Pelotomaculum sp. PtaB.Bin104]